VIGVLAAGLLLAATPSPPAAPTPAPAPTATAAPVQHSGPTTLFGGSLTVAPNEVRDGDVAVFGGTVDIEGSVTHDVRVFGGNVDVEGTVGHDLIVLGGSVQLGEHAHVGHDVNVIGGSFDRAPGATVGHEVTGSGAGSGFVRTGPPILPGPPVPGGFDLGFGLGLSVGVVLLALLLQLFLPGPVTLTRNALEDRPFASLGFGCLTAVAGVLLAALLGITVILLPASLAIAAAMLAAWLLGLAGVIVLIGQRLIAALNMRADPVPTLLVGGVLVAVLVNVPILGGLFGLLIGTMALGAVVLTRFGTRPHPPGVPPFPPAPPASPVPPAPTEEPR
jgi:hypothetical protein